MLLLAVTLFGLIDDVHYRTTTALRVTVEARRYEILDGVVPGPRHGLNVIQGGGEAGQLLGAVLAGVAIALKDLQPILSDVVVIEVSGNVDAGS